MLYQKIYQLLKLIIDTVLRLGRPKNFKPRFSPFGALAIFVIRLFRIVRFPVSSLQNRRRQAFPTTSMKICVCCLGIIAARTFSNYFYKGILKFPDLLAYSDQSFQKRTCITELGYHQLSEAQIIFEIRIVVEIRANLVANNPKE